jgi:6-phosphogluconolactonase
MTSSGGDNVSRRQFVALSALGVAGLALPRIDRGDDSMKADQMLYIGTYTDDGRSKGIYQAKLSRTTGALTLIGVAAETTNPSFVIRSGDGKAVYAVNEVGDVDGKPGGGASAFARTRPSGALRALGKQDTHGTFPCYASTDRSGRFLFVANYGSGNVAMFPIAHDGSIGAASAIIQHHGTGPNKERQEGPHAHCVIADPANRFILVADLGIDRVMVYPFNAKTGKLTTTPVAQGVAKPGAGPRHLAFGHGGRVLYVSNEVDASVTAYRYDAASGALTAIQTRPALNEQGIAAAGADSAAKATTNEPADIHVHPSGRFLYLSNRGPNSISVFTVDQHTGKLTPLQLVSCGGDWPRNFAIDPTGAFMLVANQKSDSIVTFRIDHATGRLSDTGHRLTVPVPVCVCFAGDAA